MKIYTANIDNREGSSDILGIYKEKLSAVESIKKYVFENYSESGIKYYLDDYGGNLDIGEFNSESQTIYISERELQ